MSVTSDRVEHVSKEKILTSYISNVINGIDNLG